MANGKTAIITGASSGIGRASAIALGKAGWNVVITARREEALRETKDLIVQALIAESAEERAYGARILVWPGDITSEDFVIQLFAGAVQNFGRLDLLFNNAGMGTEAIPIEDMSLEIFRSVIDVNLVASFLCTRQAFRVFKAQVPQGGRIINNGSLAAHVPRPHTSPYTTSKHAIAGLTKCAALDGRNFGITCTQLDIGNAGTEMSAATGATGALQPDGTVRTEALFDVEHVANVVVHIASLPPDVAVLELSIMAAKAPFIGRG